MEPLLPAALREDGSVDPAQDPALPNEDLLVLFRLHEAPRTCGFGAELSATIHERSFLHLKAPVARVAGFDTPFPYAMEKRYLPDARGVPEAIRAGLLRCGLKMFSSML